MNKLALCCLPLMCAWFSACAQSPTASTAPDPASMASESAAAGGGGACGRISVFDAAPRSKDLYRARLINIDGQLPGPSGARTYRVTPGKHVLEVAELIDNEQFNDLQLRQRVMQSDRYKALEVDVRPNTTYLLGSHLIEARRNFITDQSYWEPVIYDQSNETCN